MVGVTVWVEFCGGRYTKVTSVRFFCLPAGVAERTTASSSAATSVEDSVCGGVRRHGKTAGQTSSPEVRLPEASSQQT